MSSKSRRSTTRVASPSVSRVTRSELRAWSPAPRCCECCAPGRPVVEFFERKKASRATIARSCSPTPSGSSFTGEPTRRSGANCASTACRTEIVGILPPEFHFASPDIKLWTPLSFSAEEKSDDSRHSNNWSMIARLKPGASVGQGQQQIDALNTRNLERFPNLREVLINAGFHTVVKLYQDDLIESVRETLILLWGGVLFVLLIGAVNITNLAMVRSSARVKELATRQALGAGLGRLTRQLLTETVVLTLAGAALGLLLGYSGLALLTSLGIERIPRGSESANGYDGGLLYAGARPPRRHPDRPRSRRHHAADEPQPGIPRREPQRHEWPGHARPAPPARGQPGRVCVHAARGRRPAVRQLRAGAGRSAWLRSSERPDRARFSAAQPLCERSGSAFVFWTSTRARARASRRQRRRTRLERAVWRRLQRQRDPGGGLSDDAWRVADFAEPRRSHARIFRGARHRPARRKNIHRRGHRHRTTRRRRRREAGAQVLGQIESDRSANVSPGQSRRCDQARPEDAMDCGRRRGGRSQNAGPRLDGRSRRRLLLPGSAGNVPQRHPRRQSVGQSSGVDATHPARARRPRSRAAIA